MESRHYTVDSSRDSFNLLIYGLQLFLIGYAAVFLRVDMHNSLMGLDTGYSSYFSKFFGFVDWAS